MISNVSSSFINVPTSAGLCDSFIAHPQFQKQSRAVLFFMDAFGPRESLFDMARSLAANGYFVLIPNLFYRIKRAPLLNLHFPLSKEDFQQALPEILPLARGFDITNGLLDIGDYIKFLHQQPQVKKGQIAVTGYCMGGSLALRTAATYPADIAAAACFHAGQLATDKADSPHTLLSQIKAEIYIGNADNDPSLPIEQIHLLQKTLEASHVIYEMETFKNALHGFTMMDLPAYNADACAKHWDKLLALLHRNIPN